MQQPCTKARTFSWSSHRLHADFLNALFELLARAEGLVLDACPIVVDGVGRITEKFGYARTLLNAQSDEGKDAQVGGELGFGVGLDAVLGQEQRVEVGNEVGEKI